MKLRFRSALPPPDRTTRLPLLLAAMLLAALAFQLLTVDETALPPAGPIAGDRAHISAAADVARAGGGAIVLSRAVFAPRPAATGSTNPLAGVAIAGSIRIGRNAYLVVEGPGSRTARVPLGGRIGDWRVRAIRAGDALMMRGKEQLAVPFGVRGALLPDAASTRSQ